jgi:2-dehydropantoate 2-reductase
LNVGDPIEHIRKLGGKIPDARPSMLLDYNAGRRCEVDAINGAIPRLGRPLGVTTYSGRHHQGSRTPDARINGHAINRVTTKSPGEGRGRITIAYRGS